MDIYPLTYFLSVAHTLNYTKAAAEFHISRQALSKSIQKMEKQLGGRLFTVNGKKMELTELGRILEKNAVPLIQAYQSFEYNMSQYITGKAPELTLSLAYGTLLTLSLNEDLLDEYRRQYPAVLLSYELTNSDGVMELLERGEAEVGLIGSVPAYLENFYYYLLRKTGMYLNVPSGHPLARKQELYPEDLKDCLIIGTGKRNHQTRFFVEACRSCGIEPRFLTHVTDLPKIVPLMQKTGAIAFAVPETIVPAPPGITVRRLCTPGEEKFGTYAIIRKNTTLSVSAHTFLSFVKAFSQAGCAADE